jgi:hypothetical protein
MHKGSWKWLEMGMNTNRLHGLSVIKADLFQNSAFSSAQPLRNSQILLSYLMPFAKQVSNKLMASNNEPFEKYQSI